MIVDPSAIAAILLREPEAPRFRALLDANGGLMSAPSYLDLGIMLSGKGVTDAQAALDRILLGLRVEIVPFAPQHARLALEAYKKYGRGSGHPARLNFGDCITYALAKDFNEPLLFKGEDFVHTDLVAAADH